MKRKDFFVLSIPFLLQAACSDSLATIVNFNIAGTYGSTPQGFSLFSSGDPFYIQGSFDTGIAPTMVLKNGATDLQSSSAWGFYVKYGTIVNLNSSIPLDEISVNYPSNDNARNDNDYKDGMYFMVSNFFGNSNSFYQSDDYTELIINTPATQSYNGLIKYHYQERTLKDGDFTIVDTVHDEILLNITAFTTTPVPTTAWLLGTSLLGLIGLRRRVVM